MITLTPDNVMLITARDKTKTTAKPENSQAGQGRRAPSDIFCLASGVAQGQDAGCCAARLHCNQLVEGELDVADWAGGAVHIPHFQAENLLQIVVGSVLALDLHGSPGRGRRVPQDRQLADHFNGAVG